MGLPGGDRRRQRDAVAVDESGDEPVTVAVHGPREFTGDVSLLTDRPATTSGYARGETRAYRVDQGELRRTIQEIPDISDKLLEAFQARRNMLEHSGFVNVRLLGRLGDPAVTEIREFFDKNKVPHTWVDTDTPDGKTAMASTRDGSARPSASAIASC